MSWQDNYDLGIRLLAEGNYEEAILAFQAAIQIDPRQSQAYYQLANAYIGMGDYSSAANTLAEGQQQTSTDEAYVRLMKALEFLESDTVGVYIIDATTDSNGLIPGQPTDFMITAVYRTFTDTPCLLRTGSNSSDPFIFDLYAQAGPFSDSGFVTIGITADPVIWDDAPFGISVQQFGATDQHGDGCWSSDYIFLNMDGTTFKNEGGIGAFDPNGNAEPVHPLAALFEADPHAGLTTADLTLFGTPLVGLSYEDACAIAAQNAFPSYEHSEDNLDMYHGLYQGNDDPHLFIHRSTDERGTYLHSIAYSHFLTSDDDGNEIRDPDEIPVWTGIRDIYTYATLEQVLSNLGYTHSHEISAYIQDILSLPMDEADQQFQQLQHLGWCCYHSGGGGSTETNHYDHICFSCGWTDQNTRWGYGVEFEYQIAADCITNVTIRMRPPETAS